MRKFIVCVILLTGISVAQDNKLDTKPPVVTPEQKVEVLQLSRSAYQALVKVTEAQKRQLEAQRDQQDGQKELDILNSKISTKMREIRKLCNADEKVWDINDSFEWIKKEIK